MNIKNFHIINVPFPIPTCSKFLLGTFFRFLKIGANDLNLLRPNMLLINGKALSKEFIVAYVTCNMLRFGQ